MAHDFGPTVFPVTCRGGSRKLSHDFSGTCADATVGDNDAAAGISHENTKAGHEDTKTRKRACIDPDFVIS